MSENGTDRRLWFFLAAAAACVLLIPAAPGGLEWVPAVTAVTYLVLALLVAVDSRNRNARH